MNSIRRSWVLPDFNKAIEAIQVEHDELIEENVHLKKCLEEFNKDTEIEKLKGELYNVRNRSLVILNSKEAQQAKDFVEKHCNCGVCTYRVTPTGIGSVIKIECTKCGEVEDITDYDCW